MGWFRRFMSWVRGLCARHPLAALSVLAAVCWLAWGLLTLSSAPSHDAPSAAPAAPASREASPAPAPSKADGAGLDRLRADAKAALKAREDLLATSRSGATLSQWAAAADSSDLSRADTALSDAAKAAFAATGSSDADALDGTLKRASEAYADALWSTAAEGRGFDALNRVKANSQLLDAVSRGADLPSACSEWAGLVSGSSGRRMPSDGSGREKFDVVDSWASDMSERLTACASGMTPEQTSAAFGPSATSDGGR